MARKTLLTEGEIRKFMKLAQLAPLGQAKLTEYYSDEELSEQEEEEELAMDAPAEDELDMPAAEDEMEMDMDMGAEDDAGGAMGEDGVEELVQALAATIEDVTGVPVSVEGGEGDEEMDMGAEDEMEMDMEMGAEDEMGMEPGAGGEDEMAMGGEEEMVAEVARRVAARLLNQQKQKNLADELTERIFKRLTNKS